MKTAVIFSRVSSNSDRQSNKRQVEDLTSYALRNAYEVVQVFEEKISGGKKNEDRDILLSCLDYCCENKIDTLLVSELSRIGRSTLQVLKSVEMLSDANVNIYIQNISLNTLDEEKNVSSLARIIITVLAEVANIEKDAIAFRLNSGKARYIAQGGKMGKPKGAVKSAEKKKEEYRQVLTLLRKGNSVRNTAKLADVSVSTVQRLKKEFDL